MFSFVMIILLAICDARSYHHQKNEVCLKTQNVTFIMDVNDEFFYATIFEPLISKMIRNPCIKVWMYSHLKKQVIRLEEHDVTPVLTSETATQRSIDVNEFLELTSQMPTGSQAIEQHIIFIHQRKLVLTKPRESEESDEEQKDTVTNPQLTNGSRVIRLESLLERFDKFQRHDPKRISDMLKELQNQKQYNIVLACSDHSGRGFCKLCESWLPKNNFFASGFGYYPNRKVKFVAQMKHVLKMYHLVLNKNYNILIFRYFSFSIHFSTPNNTPSLHLLVDFIN